MKNTRIILHYQIIIMPEPLSGNSQTKVLLLGNRQLGVYDGITGNHKYDLSGMIKDMSESVPAEFPRIEIGLKLIGGASLKKLWELGEGPGTPRAMIATGKWDYIVIQEIYNADKLEFETYAAMFDEAIRKAGAKIILFATAGITNYFSPSFPLYPDEFKKLDGMQVSFGKERGLVVAAAGYAWMKYFLKKICWIFR